MTFAESRVGDTGRSPFQTATIPTTPAIGHKTIHAPNNTTPTASAIIPIRDELSRNSSASMATSIAKANEPAEASASQRPQDAMLAGSLADWLTLSFTSRAYPKRLWISWPASQILLAALVEQRFLPRVYNIALSRRTHTSDQVAANHFFATVSTNSRCEI
jgi:hypothetical protein